jgi:hypothetical protein
MESGAEEHRRGSLAKRLAVFLVHQLIGTWGIGVAAPLALILCSDIVRVFGVAVYMRGVHRILTETPYFPVQVLFGLFLGWLLARFLPHRSMLWVWIVPLGVLCCAVIAFPWTGQLTIPQYAGLSSSSRFAHFFGWGCSPRNRCLDQLMITMPLYSASAYSLGAWLARKMGPQCSFTQFVQLINKRRTAVFVGAPFCSVMLASEYLAYRHGTGRSVPSVCIEVAWAVVESVIVTFLFVAVTSLVARRSFLTRFLLAGNESRHD